MVTVSAVANT